MSGIHVAIFYGLQWKHISPLSHPIDCSTKHVKYIATCGSYVFNISNLVCINKSMYIYLHMMYRFYLEVDYIIWSFVQLYKTLPYNNPMFVPYFWHTTSIKFHCMGNSWSSMYHRIHQNSSIFSIENIVHVFYLFLSLETFMWR